MPAFLFAIFRLYRLDGHAGSSTPDVTSASLRLRADLRWERLSEKRRIGRIQRSKRGAACGRQSRVDPERKRRRARRPSGADRPAQAIRGDLALLLLVLFFAGAIGRTSRGTGSDGRHERPSPSRLQRLTTGTGARRRALASGKRPALVEALSATCQARVLFWAADRAFRLPRVFLLQFQPLGRRGTDRIANADHIAATRARFTIDAMFYGTLEVPTEDNDGPPNGLTLDHAIDITLDRSLDLRGKYMEIPLARADTLQASLRSNPVFYQDGQLLQYGGTSTNSPGGPGGPQPVRHQRQLSPGHSHKRQARTMVATRAERVLEALSGCRTTANRRRLWCVCHGSGGASDGSLCDKSVEGLGNLKVLNEQRYQKGVISLGELNAVRSSFGKHSSVWLMLRRPTARPSWIWDR